MKDLALLKIVFPLTLGLMNLSRTPNAVLSVEVYAARARHRLGLRLDSTRPTEQAVLPLPLPAFGIAQLDYLVSCPVALTYPKEEAEEMEEGETMFAPDLSVVVKDIFGRTYVWEERYSLRDRLSYRIWQVRRSLRRLWERGT